MGQLRDNWRTTPYHFRSIWKISLVAILLSASSFSSHADDQLIEYRLKAAFIYNISKFIQWPSAQPTEEPAVEHTYFCIDASDDVFRIMHENLHQYIIDNKTIEVTKWPDIKDSETCSIIFSAMDTKNRTQQIDGTLTIGESEDFIRQGGMIRFYKEAKRLRFEINPEQAKTYHIDISSKLLRLARIVRVKNPAEESVNE